ncbi:MAG: ABC transporter substrate-binding protein/permease [Oscillospiraceae bacterium]|nr:ABC transporter substrate-binding protein/permease [Oscillospiraceae bacterium]
MKLSKKIGSLFLIFTIAAAALCGCGNEIGESKVKTIDDLPGAIIGTQLGTTGDIYASDYEEEGSVIKQFNKGSDAIMALKQGKVDCVIIDNEPAKKYVSMNQNLSILDEEFVVEDYAICIAKENTELKDKINLALADLKEKGTLNEIILNYIGDESGNHPYVSPEGVNHSNGKLVMATNAQFEPYEYRENGEIVGIDVDMATALCDYLGMELEIQDIEFDSIITAVQSGKADIGVAGMTITEDRLKNVNFSDPYTTATQVIIVRNGGDSGNLLQLKEKFENNFIKDNRWKFITDGLLHTIQISFFAVLIGIVLGFLLAIIRFTCDTTRKFRILNWICKMYITVIRGTPAMIQLLIIYYVIFASVNINPVFVATVAFGLNSSAYMAEIVRSGISSIDIGQFEAGRSMGFNYVQTMWNFILPQAIRNILPALGNEFIVLLKETSISGYIGIIDLTRGGDLIRSRTYDAFMPLIGIALIYLAMVMFLSMLVGKLERRLKNDVK